MLVEKGANVNIAGDGYGVTPLWAAINTRWQPRTRFPQPQEMDYQKATYLDVMKALLEAGADPDARVKGHPWYMVYSGCGNGNCGLSNVTGSTAFWRAAYGTDVDAMKLLVKYGADPEHPDDGRRRWRTRRWWRRWAAAARGRWTGAARAARRAGAAGAGDGAQFRRSGGAAGTRDSIPPVCLRFQPAAPACLRFTRRPAPNTAKASPATRIVTRRTAGSRR